MDRPRPDRFNDRPAARFNDRPGDAGGRHSRWSDGPPRYPRGGGEGFSAGGGGRHHPYRDTSQDSPGGGPAFRDGPGGGPAFRDGLVGGPGFRDAPGGGPAFRDGQGGGPGFREGPGGGPGFRDGPGDGPGFRDGSGRGTGFHDAPSGGPGFPDAPGGVPGFRDGPGGGVGFRDGPGGGTGFHGGPGGFGQEMPMGGSGGGLKRSFHGRGGGSPDLTDWSKFVKLFVGSVPRTATEEEIRPLFEEQGDVVEVALIKDKRTGQQQGCCFIKYATSEEADRAIKALHNQYTLPGGTGPIQVRYADGERENHGTVEHKLFVASLNREATEKEIEEIFSPYGHVEDVYLMRDEAKQSRGSGFVKFSTREMAAAALNALHGTFVMRGCDQPLIVRFANPKRPRPGESRGGPAFGGPGFGPRSEASPLMRPISHGGDQTAGNMFPNAWNQNSTQSLGPPSQGSNNGFHTQSAPKDIVVSSAASGIAGVPSDSRMSLPAAPSSSQQSFNPSMVQVQPAVGQQTSTLQKPLVSPQDLQNSSQLHYNQHMSTPQLQGQNLQTPMQQPGQPQVQQSIGLPPFGQSVPSQQFPGGVLQISAPQNLIQHNGSAPANALLQAPLGLQHQGLPPVANPQQLSSSAISQQLFQQPIQQLPSQLPQVMLQQQAQALQSSFQSSQQAILQLQQQLQQMQQSSHQQGSQTVKQQMPSLWSEQQTNSNASTPVATVTSTASATQAHPIAASVPLSCNWTEHTSPEGYKYYYNSATRESKWEKPEELTVFEQQQQQQKLLLLQQQQQKLAVQQLQSPSQSLPQGHIQPSQQLPQSQNVQAQMQPRQQAQLQILQPSLEYQASGVTGNQNIQGSYYTHIPAANSVIDPNRVQQGIQPTQEWAWQNKPAGP